MLAHPLGALFGIAHGEAIALVLCEVMRRNLDYAMEKFADIAMALGENTSGLTARSAAELAVDAVSRLCQRIGLTRRLRDFRLKEEDFSEILKGVEKSTSHLKETNPCPMTEELLLEILRVSM